MYVILLYLRNCLYASPFCIDGYICVYWDVEDYPIPQDFEPRLIFKNIKSALSKMGFGGSFLGIEAYGMKEIPEALSEELIEDGMIMYNVNPKGIFLYLNILTLFLLIFMYVCHDLT